MLKLDDLAVRVSDGQAEAIIAALKEEFPGLDCGETPAREDAATRMFVGFRPPQDEALSGYHWLHSTGAGIDKLLAGTDDERFTGRVTRTTGRMGAQIGEYCLAYALARLQRFHSREAAQCNHRWATAAGTPRYLFEARVAVMGTGAIGGAVADRFSCLGADVTGYSRTGRKRPGFETVQSLETFNNAPAPDICILALPATPETANLVSTSILEHMDGGLLINVGRGSTLDPQALRAALAEGHVGRAVLDVFEDEPLNESDWRWSHSDVTVTPHVAGLTRARDAAETVCQLLSAALEGREIATADLSRGY